MRKFFRFALVALAAVALIPAAVMAKPLINGIDANYPPFAYVDKAGNPAGFDVDAMNWIAKKMGFEVKHQPMDWDGIIPALLAKKIDMVCSGMSISPERTKVVTFTEPYWSVQKVFIVKKDSKLTVKDICSNQKNIGVQRGTNEHEILEKILKEGGSLPGVSVFNYKLRFYDSSPLAIQDLMNGRIDAVGLDSAPAQDAIRKGAQVQIVGEFAPADVFGVATRNDDKELRAKLNEGFKLLKADPYWNELQKKHMN